MFYDKLPGANSPASAGQTAEGNLATCILLFGEVLVDCFPDREVAGGAPLNVAHHLARLGQGVGVLPVLVTRIGKDEPGQRLLESIQAAGLPVDGVQQDCLHPTGTARIALDASAGHRFEIAPDQAWDFIHADMARLVGLMSRPQWIYFGTLAQRAASRPALRSLLQTTRAKGFLDVNLRDPWVRKDVLRWSLGKTEIVKMNEAELHRVAHMVGLGSGAPRELARRLSHAYDIRNVLVTQGEQGAWLQTADGACFQTHPAQPVADVASEAVDSVGAGDAFAAVFLLGQTQGWPPQLTLDRAHQFAGQICRVRGAIPDSTDFYRPFIKAWDLAMERVT
ncbi:MAG: PfkB family carbohydrate kinase [Gammaproteobacteria bacterium]|uniref:PfkB family carbohydrate kinase n=1 Tax=Thiobacillus sp. TaxID=924 RepID=UPI0025FFF17B|nr:PfkB family carbohydrate kinase [Thiobacillus sp.]